MYSVLLLMTVCCLGTEAVRRAVLLVMGGLSAGPAQG